MSEEGDLLDELDLALVHALQIDARTPWARVASVLGVDSATVTRHWRGLRERRAAWLTLWPTPQRWAASSDLAIIVLDLPPEPEGSAVRDAVLDLPWVIGVDDTSAGLVAVVASSNGLDALGGHRRHLAALGAREQRMHVVATLAQEDSTWRLSALSRDQQRALTKPRASPTIPRSVAPHIVAEIAAALEDDPRLPTLTLAHRLGVSEPTARRTVERVIASGLLRAGCDLAMPAAGLGRSVVLWARAVDVDAAALRASRLPEAHRVAVAVGTAPLYVAVRTRSLNALPRIEHAWHETAGLEITDRWAVLRTWKRNGHILDEQGRSIRRVALVW